jgi:amidase
MWHDGVVLPQPPIRRALKALVDVLTKNSAFEVVEYVPFKHFEASELVVSRNIFELYCISASFKSVLS